MSMLDDHPLAVWSSVVITLVTMAVGVAGAWYFIMDERERSIEQNERLSAIQQEQVYIRKELALQTADLEEIRKMQGTIVGTVDRRFDKIEDGHDRIVSEVSRNGIVLAVELGRVSERHKEELSE